MKRAVHNIGSKPIHMPGGKLLPGGVKVYDLPEKIIKQLETVESLELTTVVKKRAKKKDTKTG